MHRIDDSRRGLLKLGGIGLAVGVAPALHAATEYGSQL